MKTKKAFILIVHYSDFYDPDVYQDYALATSTNKESLINYMNEIVSRKKSQSFSDGKCHYFLQKEPLAYRRIAKSDFKGSEEISKRSFLYEISEILSIE